jgi:hypothetical protein
MAWLKALVIGMGILIIAGLGVLVTTMVKRGGKMMGDKTPASVSASSGAFVHSQLNVGDRCEIVESHTDAGRLVLWIDGPGPCRRIVVLDIATGSQLGVISIQPERVLGQ